MTDYLFEIVGEDSLYCGEQFFVERDTLEEAWQAVREYFGDEEVEYLEACTPEEAEIAGLDTY